MDRRTALQRLAIVAFVAWALLLWAVPDAVLGPYWIAAAIVTLILFALTFRIPKRSN